MWRNEDWRFLNVFVMWKLKNEDQQKMWRISLKIACSRAEILPVNFVCIEPLCFCFLPQSNLSFLTILRETPALALSIEWHALELFAHIVPASYVIIVQKLPNRNSQFPISQLRAIALLPWKTCLVPRLTDKSFCIQFFFLYLSCIHWICCMVKIVNKIL